MQFFELSRDIAQLAVLQRIELASPILKKIRKIFGRYLFSNFFSKYFINPKKISKDYYSVMNNEYSTIEKLLEPDKQILSIGSGIGGLEVIIDKNFNDCFFTFIERNFISKKIKYGWDNNNSEAYNKLQLLMNFLLINKIKREKFEIIDFDREKLPQKKYDIIISLYSLDFHYKFEIYETYLREASNVNTVIIFDTVRSQYFNKIFKHVEILKEDNNTLHKSKRIACKLFI